jgi:hypothetical protein
LVIINAGRNGVVIFLELLLGDDVVRGGVFTHVVSGFKSFKELLENLLLGLLSSDNIRVLVSSVNTTEVVNVNVTISIGIKFGEGLTNKGFAVGVHGAADQAKELIVFDKARMVVVEGSEEGGEFSLGEAKHVVLHSLCEFILVKRHAVVVVHDTELLAEADNTTRTTRGKLLAETVNKIVGSGLGAGRGSGVDFTTKNSVGELFVLKRARLVSVVERKEGVEILIII